jgi:predicted transcriptional regulator of viral defense system
MRTELRNTRARGYYTIREAAWILGVEPSVICRAVRRGAVRAVWRGRRLMIPAEVLARQLAGSVAAGSVVAGSVAAGDCCAGKTASDGICAGRGYGATR